MVRKWDLFWPMLMQIGGGGILRKSKEQPAPNCREAQQWEEMYAGLGFGAAPSSFMQKPALHAPPNKDAVSRQS